MQPPNLTGIISLLCIQFRKGEKSDRRLELTTMMRGAKEEALVLCGHGFSEMRRLKCPARPDTVLLASRLSWLELSIIQNLLISSASINIGAPEWKISLPFFKYEERDGDELFNLYAFYSCDNAFLLKASVIDSAFERLSKLREFQVRSP